MPREPVHEPILLLLDRDGTLMDDVGYPNDPAAVRLLPGAADAVATLHRRGYIPAVVSNQSGLARGLITPAEAQAVHERFHELFLAASGLRLPCFYCPHGPDDGCSCRKPQPGLLAIAAAELKMTGRPALMVGDKLSDVQAGIQYGARTIWLQPDRIVDHEQTRPDARAADWSEVLRRIEDWERTHVSG